MSRKGKILELVRKRVEQEYETVSKAARASREAATDPDSKAESKYDTRSLEMSYLAAGQARQAEELAEAMEYLEGLELREFEVTERVDVGALVEVEDEGVWSCYLLLGVAGGVSVSDEEGEVTVLTPESPLFTELKGTRVGDYLAGERVVSDLI